MPSHTGGNFSVAALAVATAVALAACAGGGGQQRAVPASPLFSVPNAPSAAIPKRPSFAAPRAPAGGILGRRTASAHAVFFSGEAALGNGVYYLQFPNSTLFGYYGYLSDAHYVYHFDLGYEYVFDSSDANSVYFYDFPSGHFWWTGANLFPYVYDFTLGSFLYYYPDTQNGGHYTTNPRYFYNYKAAQIITMPAQTIPLLLNVRISWANTAQSTSSFSLSLDVLDANHGQIAHAQKTVSTNPSTSGVRSTGTDNISASYPQGAGATYQLTVNGGQGVSSPCTFDNNSGSGTVNDANSGNANAYPTVSLTCN